MAAIERLKPEDLQWLLMEHGYDLGSYGADGVWGSKTDAAIQAWFGHDEDLCKPSPAPQPDDNVIPSEWLPDCKMTRIVTHWTAGSYTVSATDKEHYHFIIGGDLKLVRGDNSIKANVSTSDADGYAAHTKNLNTGSIGIAVACMAGAVESPFNAGAYPLTKKQGMVLAQVTAECCRKYGIQVTPQTVLQHGEVQKNLGVAQDGKWDITKVAWNPSMSAAEVCSRFREEVSKRL